MLTGSITLPLIASRPLGTQALHEEKAIQCEKLNFVLTSNDARYIAGLGPGGFKLWERDPVHLIGSFADPPLGTEIRLILPNLHQSFYGTPLPANRGSSSNSLTLTSTRYPGTKVALLSQAGPTDACMFGQ